MLLQTLLDKSVAWLAGRGPEDDVVVYCRGSLSRNLADFPFPRKCSDHERESIEERLLGAVNETGPFSREQYYPLMDLDPVQTVFLIERELMSGDLLEAKGSRGVLVAIDQSASIVINGSDHIRMQTVLPGLQPQELWSQLNMLDYMLADSLDFAFDDRLGFLTAGLDRVGTGLKMTVVLHLPALAMANQILRTEQALRDERYELTGLFGSVGEAKGELYCLTNIASLGRSEEEVAFNLRQTVMKLVTEERDARERLMSEARTILEDRVGRAYGVAGGARLLEFNEGMKLLASIRLGWATGLLEKQSVQSLNELLTAAQPGHLQMKAGHPCEELEQSIERATLFRAHFG